MAIRFKVKLERYQDTEVLHVYLPFDVFEAFGTRARLAVKGSINGFPFRSSIFPMGGGKFYMVANREMREGAKLKADDTAEFLMEKDDDPRTITTPPDLLKALNGRKSAKKVWDRLSHTHRKEHIVAIESAKKPETRARRIAKTLEMLSPLKKPEAAPSQKQMAKKTVKKASKKATKSRAKKASERASVKTAKD
jgi:hypothetical protein